MNKVPHFSGLRGNTRMADWIGSHRRGQIKAVFQVLFRLSCWSGVVWLVWNHSLSGFLDAGGMNVWQSFGVGTLLCVASQILGETEDRWDREVLDRLSR